MTALCSGGTSGPKAGVAETLVFTTGALASILNNKGGAWATLAAPLLGVLSYDALEFCGTDPPSVAELTAAEYTALLQLSPWDTLQTAIGKLAAIVSNALWYDLCECKTTTTPAQPTGLLLPPDGVVAPFGNSGPCIRRTYRATAAIKATSGTATPSAAYYNVAMFPDFPTVAVPNNPGFASPHSATVMPVPIWPWWKLSAQLVSPSNNAAQDVNVLALTLRNDFFFLHQQPVTLTPSAPSKTPQTGFADTNTTASYFDLAVFQVGGTTPAVVDVTLEFFCAGTSPTTSTSPCGTDPAVLALLGQIMQTVTLIQRQAVPFAYVFGDTHSGLSGNGHVDVQGLLGGVLTLTTVPGWIGTDSGDPDALFDVGWFNWGTADGALPRAPIRSSPQLSLPRTAGALTRFSYSLSPGVELELTEVVREP